MIFKATTKDGRLFIVDKSKFQSYLKQVTGKNIYIKVEHTTGRKRSVEQNDLYYGIVRKILVVLLDRGFDDLNVVTLSHYFKRKFLLDVIIDPVTGDEIEIVKSTTDLKTKEFSDYIDRVVRFAIQDMDITTDELKPYLDSDEVIL